jgi:hypothetical protein
MSGVWKDIWTSLKTVWGVTAPTVALGLAILGSLWDPGIKVQIGVIWLAVIALIIVSALATAIKMVLETRRSAQPNPPRAVYVHVLPATADATNQALILVMERSRQFGVNILVTVYYEEGLAVGRAEIFERTIGIGRVINIQENGLIQVRLLREVSNHGDLWQRIRNRDTATLSNVIIKPSIDFNDAGIEVRFNE